MTKSEVVGYIQAQVDFPISGANRNDFARSLNELIGLLNELLDEGVIRHTIYPANIPPLTILNVKDFSLSKKE